MCSVEVYVSYGGFMCIFMWMCLARVSLSLLQINFSTYDKVNGHVKTNKLKSQNGDKILLV